ncbi:hypothetical protein GE09DRAFT_627865 [Coniochaeta sp. 2T2.1]|nr:hypothetical protein GE09DRAFT_627865 [Coniochaeta sp. 2T2.1]
MTSTLISGLDRCSPCLAVREAAAEVHLAHGSWSPTGTTGTKKGGKAKVKSGCRTCKARKIKCDEAFPICRRCSTTGRNCDGYGIWGGGGNARSPPSRVTTDRKTLCIATRNSCTARASLGSPMFISPVVASPDQAALFHWFQARTSCKLPGSFSSHFWSTLLLQSSFGEPAIFHAVLALSSVHKRGVLNSDREELHHTAPDKLERFGLHHYLESIGHLQRHLTGGRNRASCRVALIACIVFVSMDFLRGHFSAGQIHLDSGLKLLQQTCSGPGPSLLAFDEWIIEFFSRLYLQVRLFNRQSLCPYRPLVLRPRSSGIPSLGFHCLKEAWHEIEKLMDDIFLLTDQARDLPSDESSPCRSVTIVESQLEVRHRAAQWLNKYETWVSPTVRAASMVDTRAWYLLRSYHTMVTIMAEVALDPLDEVLFDAYTHLFVRLLDQLRDLRTASSAWLSYPAPLGRNLRYDMARSIIDLGWIPPLFFTVIKCRVPTIRLEAVQLLESTCHREGIWDGRMLARVGRRVIELEEQDFFDHVNPRYDATSYGRQDSGALRASSLPSSYRMHDLEVVLTGDPVRLVTLRFKREKGFDGALATIPI